MNIVWLNVYGVLFVSLLKSQVFCGPEEKQGTICLSCQKESKVSLDCSKKERIAFKGIYYGGKNVISCKFGAKFDCENSIPSCCIPDRKRDCAALSEKDVYYQNCIGLQSCTITFMDDQMTCSKDASIKEPNYAGITYYCIPDKNFVYLELNSLSKGKITYLINKAYPSAVEDLSKIQCSVETKCGKRINIHALDLYLGYDKEKGCTQELVIQDGENTVKKTCFQNNQLKRVRYHVSETNFILLTFINKIPSKEAFIWLEFAELREKEDVELICGNQVKIKPSSCKVRHSVVTQKPKLISTETESTTQANLNVTQDAQFGESLLNEDDEDTKIKAISLSIVIVLLVVCGIVGGIYYCKKYKTSKISPDDDDEPTPPNSTSTDSDTDQMTQSTSIDSPRNVDSGDDVDEGVNTDNWRSRRKNFIPPLPDFPDARTRNRVLPSLGERHLPSSSRLPQETRQPLPKISSRSRRKIKGSEQ